MINQPSQPSIYRNRFLQALIMSTLFLQIGIWVRNFAVLLFVMDRTENNPYAVSLISLAEFAPIFLFSFIGGTFADRWRPKRTMIWCDTLSAVSVFFVLLTIIYGTWEAVFFVTFVSSILSQFSQPSAMKLFKLHLPGDYLQKGMALFQTVMAIFIIIGPVLGTFVYQRFGIYFAIGVMGVAFLISAAVLMYLPPDQADPEPEQTAFWQEFAGGFRYVWERRILAILAGVFLVAGLAVGVITPLGIFLVTEQLGLPKEKLQWLMATNGAAMLIGGGLVFGFTQRFAPQKLLALGLLASTIAVIGIGWSTELLAALVFQFLSGFFMPSIHIAINTLILGNTEEAFVGRVNGVLNPLFSGGMVIAMSVTGWLKAHLPIEAIYLGSGVLFFTGVLLMVSVSPVIALQEQS